MAFWAKCAPCHLRYDVIGTVETSMEDAKYIAAKTGMPNAPYANRRLHTRDDFSMLCCQVLTISQLF